jgi:hypothetical protein
VSDAHERDADDLTGPPPDVVEQAQEAPDEDSLVADPDAMEGEAPTG